MPTIHLNTFINASPETCFDLSRSIELHLQSTAHTQEKAVAGRTSGLCEMGDTITWEAIHFGIRQRLTVRITAMERPDYFIDEMVNGAFKSFHHVHTFSSQKGGTLMQDQFIFKAPLGLLGRLAEILILKSYMTRLLQKRNALIREIAETQSPNSPVVIHA